MIKFMAYVAYAFEISVVCPPKLSVYLILLEQLGKAQ